MKKSDWQMEKATIDYAIQMLNYDEAKLGDLKYEVEYAILPEDNSFRSFKYGFLSFSS